MRYLRDQERSINILDGAYVVHICLIMCIISCRLGPLASEISARKSEKSRGFQFSKTNQLDLLKILLTSQPGVRTTLFPVDHKTASWHKSTSKDNACSLPELDLSIYEFDET